MSSNTFVIHSRWIHRGAVDIQTNSCIDDDDDNDRMPDNSFVVPFQDMSITPEHRLGLVSAGKVSSLLTFGHAQSKVRSRTRTNRKSKHVGKQDCLMDCRLDRMCRKRTRSGLSLSSAMHSPTRTGTLSCGRVDQNQSNRSSCPFCIYRAKRTDGNKSRYRSEPTTVGVRWLIMAKVWRILSSL